MLKTKLIQESFISRQIVRFLFWNGCFLSVMLLVSHSAQATQPEPGPEYPLNSEIELLRSDAILNGNLATERSQNRLFTVYLDISLRNGESTRCTGVLVSHHLVLTAGHCLAGFDITQIKVQFGVGQNLQFDASVVAEDFRYHYAVPPSEEGGGGSWWINGRLRPPDPPLSTQLRKLNSLSDWVNFFRHQGYGGESSTTLKEIGLIKIPFVPNGFRPARVYQGSFSFRDTVYVAGFGAFHPIRDKNTGGLHWARHELIGHYTIPGQTTLGLVSYSRQGQGVCGGDSGGPLLIRQSGELQLIGIHVRSAVGCQTDSLALYVRGVSAWIQDAARSLGQSLSL